MALVNTHGVTQVMLVLTRRTVKLIQVSLASDTSSWFIGVDCFEHQNEIIIRNELGLVDYLVKRDGGPEVGPLQFPGKIRQPVARQRQGPVYHMDTAVWVTQR